MDNSILNCRIISVQTELSTGRVSSSKAGLAVVSRGYLWPTHPVTDDH